MPPNSGRTTPELGPAPSLTATGVAEEDDAEDGGVGGEEDDGATAGGGWGVEDAVDAIRI